jgi:hypothetical protein
MVTMTVMVGWVALPHIVLADSGNGQPEHPGDYCYGKYYYPCYDSYAAQQPHYQYTTAYDRTR